ncbi:hypothetical protein QUF72_01815 [Desulfobacterales bacterium HSG2]|nr:hypothetical protein [Desulfobacterales bacterium HSG2]
MKWKKWLENWDMTSLKIKTPFLEMEWNPREADRNAAWELYVELLTRVTTRELDTGEGDEETALQSIYSIFGTTRNVIKHYGRDCLEFTKIAVLILNQVINPFTAKWHKLQMENAFQTKEGCHKFRKELSELQPKLRNYTKMLGDMAGVEEDLTELEDFYKSEVVDNR